MKYSKAKQPTVTPTSAASKQHDIAIPMFGYKNHACIDRAHGFIRGWAVTSASAHDGAQLRNVVTRDNTASTVWADSAYRSKTNEEWLKDNGLKSNIHQRKPEDKPMPEAMSRANGRRSKIRSAVEHVFARQKDKMKLFIRTIGISRATVKIGIANLVYNMLRYVFHEGRRAAVCCRLPRRGGDPTKSSMKSEPPTAIGPRRRSRTRWYFEVSSLAEPQQGQLTGAAMTTRSRGRCSGYGLRRTPALDAPDRRGACCHLRGQFVFAGSGFQLLELQLHLFEKPGLALRAFRPHRTALQRLLHHQR